MSAYSDSRKSHNSGRHPHAKSPFHSPLQQGSHRQSSLINKTKKQQLLKEKIKLQQQIIANIIQNLKCQLEAPLQKLRQHLLQRLHSFHLFFREILNTQNHTRKQKDYDERSPFDLSSSLDLELSIIQEMDHPSNKSLKDKLELFISDYIEAGTLTMLFQQQKMQIISNKLIQKMKRYMYEISQKHVEYLVQVSTNTKNMRQIINQCLLSAIKNKSQNTDDPFKELYQRLQHSDQSNQKASILQTFGNHPKKMQSQQIHSSIPNSYSPNQQSQSIAAEEPSNPIIQKQYIKQPFFVIKKQESPIKIEQKSERMVSESSLKQVKSSRTLKDRLDAIKIDELQQCLTVEWCEDITIVGGQLLESEAFRKPQNAPILCVYYIPQTEHYPQYLALGSKNSNIYIHETAQNSLITKLQGHSSGICTLVSFFNNRVSQNFLISGSDTGCNSIILWNIKQWTIYSRINYHMAAVTSILPFNDYQGNQYILTGSYDRTLKVFNLSHLCIEQQLTQKFNGPVISAYFINNQKQRVCVVVAGVGILIFRVINQIAKQQKSSFDLQLGSQIELQTEYNVLVTALNIIPGTPRIVLGFDSGQVMIINTETLTKETLDLRPLLCTPNSKVAILGMLVINRLHKPNYPLIIIGLYGIKKLIIVNWQTKSIQQLRSQNQIQLKYGCGVGPLLTINEQLRLVMVSQGQSNSINIMQLKFY